MYVPRHQQYNISPIWIESIPGTLSYLIKWAYYGDYASPLFKVFVNGQPYADTYNTQQTISNLRQGVNYRIDILALSDLENVTHTWGSFFFVPAKGSKFAINIPEVDLTTNPDFWSYLIYSSDDGTEPTTLLKELVGANNNVLTTDSLQDGLTYKFRVKLKDIHGNESAYGPTVSGVVNTLPESVLNAAVSYNQATRTATISANKPSPQDADATGYNLYSNDLPAYGLQPTLVELYPLQFFPSGALSYVTQELGEGLHKWAWRAVDGTGFESEYTAFQLNLVRVSGQLTQISAPPDKPYYIDAKPIASGVINVSLKILAPSGVSRLNIYRDDALDGFVAGVPGTFEYGYQTGTLTHAQQYGFKASAVAGNIESPFTQTVYATADSVPPSGTLSISLSLVD